MSHDGLLAWERSLRHESREIIKKITDNCDLLNDGWNERIEYVEPVKYHRGDRCEMASQKADTCLCPTVNEKRVRKVKRPGLLKQLKNYQANCDSDRAPKSERGSPRVKTPRMHPELRGYLTLDEITVDAYATLDRILEEGGRDRLFCSQKLYDVFRGLSYQVAQFVDHRPDLARQVLKATDKWVRMARTTLRLTVAEAMFSDTVCGNCGGGLAVAWDNSTDVTCIGTMAAPPCGETYPMSEWVALYENGKKN